jgi:nucleotide-binding universal stress UspA family protein
MKEWARKESAMKTIIVGVDGSPGSLNAAELALSVARRVEAKLVFLHASPPLFTAASPPLDTLRELQLHETQAVQDATQPVIAKAQKAGLQSEFVALNDVAPAQALVEAADRLDAWLVVVGDRGRHGVARMLLGSVADRTVHLCHRPVIVAK